MVDVWSTTHDLFTLLLYRFRYEYSCFSYILEMIVLLTHVQFL